MVIINNRYLKINTPEIVPRVARCLPPALAWRYHALPLAEDRGRVTVAMADPANAEAQEAVMAALGSSVHFVQADAQVIECALAQLWPEWSGSPLRLLTWAATDALAAAVKPYAQTVAELLDAHLDTFETEEKGFRALLALAAEAESGRYDLVILTASDQFLLKKLFSDSPEHKFMDQVSVPLLVARQPRLPLKKILLVLRSEEAKDGVAVDWTVRIVRSSGAAVTVLPIIPPIPRMYDGAVAMQHGLPALLSTDTSLGREMRRVAHCLVDWEIEGTLRLRDGPPYQQICKEVTEGDYDLIVIAAEPHNRLLRWLKGEMANPLLSWADRPVLIAKPLSAYKEQEN